MSRDPTSTGGVLASMIAQWRSTRQMHRIFLILFVLLTIFLLDRYRSALGTTMGVAPGPGAASTSADSQQQHSHSTKPDTRPAMERSMERASNSTLGFHKIYYINMKARFDREDSMAIQSYLTGLNITDFPAVEPDDIDPVGFPPTHRPMKIRVGERGCWRAHANIWSEMVRHKLPPVLIMESDATWDLNVRPIMANVNKHFVEFLNKIGSKAVHDPSWDARASGSKADGRLDYDPNDPWLSAHWDIFSFGQCFEHPQDANINLIYDDPSVPSGKDYWGHQLGNQRVLRKSGGITCTTSYAVSHTGAAKLLMRSAVDLDNPVDLLIRRLTLSRDLTAYSIMPPIIAQWEYRNDVGMGERGAQSDINGGKHKDTPEDANMPGWDAVKKQPGSVWTTKGLHRDVAFDKMAMSSAWEVILGDAVLEKSWWNPETGD